MNNDGSVGIKTGTAKIGDGVSVTGVSGQVITNPTDSGSDTITVATDEGKDTVTVPSGTDRSVSIVDTTYTNPDTPKAMTLEVTKMATLSWRTAPFSSTKMRESTSRVLPTS